MFPFNIHTFPFTDFNKLNLDFILDILNHLKGGETGEALVKKTDEEYDFEWLPGAGGVISVNGQTGAVTISGVGVSSVLCVSVDGYGDYRNVQDAIDAASDGDTILVFPGTYPRFSNYTNHKELHVIGVDKNSCIIYDDSADYRTPPISWCNGTLSNLTVIEDHSNPDPSLETGDDSDGKNFNLERAYCIHMDGFYAVGKHIRVENCILKNTKRAAIGMGLKQDNAVEIINCDIWSGVPTRGLPNAEIKRGAWYVHNDAVEADVTGQKLFTANNRVYCDDDFALYIGDYVPTKTETLTIEQTQGYYLEATNTHEVISQDSDHWTYKTVLSYDGESTYFVTLKTSAALDCVLYADANDLVIGKDLERVSSTLKTDYQLTVPSGCAKIYLSGSNQQNIGVKVTTPYENECEMSFINNIFYSTVNGTDSAVMNGQPVNWSSSNIDLGGDSFGNNVSVLNPSP